jgi:hypothetical protein
MCTTNDDPYSYLGQKVKGHVSVFFTILGLGAVALSIGKNSYKTGKNKGQ